MSGKEELDEIKEVFEREPDSLEEGLDKAEERLSALADRLLRERADDDDQIVQVIDQMTDKVKIVKRSVNMRREAFPGRESEEWGWCLSYLQRAEQRLQQAAVAAERALKQKSSG